MPEILMGKGDAPALEDSGDIYDAKSVLDTAISG